MTDLVVLAVAGTATALATGLGVVPVLLLGDRARGLRPGLWGFAAGAMTVASFLGLLRPALQEGSPAAVAAGLIAGVAFLVVTRRLLNHRRSHRVTDRPGASSRARVLLVFVVLLVHSLPEGLAMGAAYASTIGGLALFVIVAIAAQNVPEGTAIAIPMEEAGVAPARQFWAAVGTSVPQPIGAIGAYLLVEQVSALLPLTFAFAAGAMLSLVASDLLPSAFRETAGRWSAGIGTALGALVMVVLSALLGV